ncbi:hypothetical protein [Acetobacter sp. A11-2]|uniref:hypothetical protein n=1 Tax=Acetobacter sp. A11-2 TaxID=3157859 RepID=UPI0032EFA19C
MDEENPIKSEEADKSSGEEPTVESSESHVAPAATKPDADAAAQPVVLPKASTTSGRDITKIRASALRDPLDGGIARPLRESIARDLGLIRGPLDDLIPGRNQLSGVARAVTDAQKAKKAARGLSAIHDRMTRATAGLDALGGIEKVMRQQRARRLELRLRRFIERKMMAKLGPKWSKQRVPGKTVTGWRARRQTDINNGRTPSRLFDYAGFEDYRAIIEQKDNWAEVFEPIFKVKTSILETLRRLSLIRNPDAHYRIVTIEDFLDLHTEGRRLDAWMDTAS